MNTQSTTRDFYIGGFLVALQAVLGFLRFPTSPGVSFYLALVASVAITVSYFLKHGWARIAAILVAIFGIVGELQQIIRPAALPSIAVSIAVVFWLSRKTVKAGFKAPNALNRSDDVA